MDTLSIQILFFHIDFVDPRTRSCIHRKITLKKLSNSRIAGIQGTAQSNKSSQTLLDQRICSFFAAGDAKSFHELLCSQNFDHLVYA